MMPEEKEAAELLRQVVHDARAGNKDHMVVPVQWVGLLLCAVGRLEFMERVAEETVHDADLSLPIRRAAGAILGWKPGEHGVP